VKYIVDLYRGIGNCTPIHFTGATMEQITLMQLTGIVAFARAASLGSFTAAVRLFPFPPRL
jgi:hypothetical protein